MLLLDPEGPCFDKHEWTAESYALKLLGGGVAPHALLMLSLISREMHKDSNVKVPIFRTHVYKKTVLMALKKLDIDFIRDEVLCDIG